MFVSQGVKYTPHQCPHGITKALGGGRAMSQRNLVTSSVFFWPFPQCWLPLFCWIKALLQSPSPCDVEGRHDWAVDLYPQLPCSTGPVWRFPVSRSAWTTAKGEPWNSASSPTSPCLLLCYHLLLGGHHWKELKESRNNLIILLPAIFKTTDSEAAHGSF